MSVDVEQLAAGVRLQEDALVALETQRTMLVQNKEDYATEVAQLEESVDVALKTRELFQTLTDAKRELVREKIELLVTSGIQAVFGPNYGFSIEQKIARNQITFEYKITYLSGGEWHKSPLRGYHGGGLVALVGLLLRVVMVLFTYPPRRRFIVLDETLAALDGDKRPLVAKLMRNLGDELELQFLLVTHSPEYAEDADVVLEVRPSQSGHSQIVRVS